MISSIDLERLKRVVASVGTRKFSKFAQIHEHTLFRALGEQPVQRSTQRCIVLALDELERKSPSSDTQVSSAA